VGSGSRKVVFSSTAGLARPAESYLHRRTCQWWSERAKMRTEASAERGRERAGCARFIPLDTPTPIYISKTAGNFPGNPTKQRIKPYQTGISSFHGVAFRRGVVADKRVTITIGGLLWSGCQCWQHFLRERGELCGNRRVLSATDTPEKERTAGLGPGCPKRRAGSKRLHKSRFSTCSRVV